MHTYILKRMLLFKKKVLQFGEINIRIFHQIQKKTLLKSSIDVNEINLKFFVIYIF